MKNDSNGYKVKDFVFLGIITAIYFVIFMAIAFATAGLSAIGHAFSPAMFSLIGGTIILFLVYKVPKFGILTIQTLLMMGVLSLMGMFYLPWVITCIVGALIADIICYTGKYKNTITNAIGYGIMQVGQSLGGIIPAVFFAESFKKTWMDKGMTAQQMEETIAASVGWIAIIVIIVTFVASFVGVLIGRKILSKHFKSIEE